MTHFYLSNDKKYYCFYLNISWWQCSYYLFGIIEKSTEKHLMMVGKFKDNMIECYYIKHHMFNYYPSDKFLKKTAKLNPLTTISFNTKKTLSDHHKPQNIIDSLEDYFLTLFDELAEL
ncbi:hypothetical protein QLL95_gp0383 [Cotonvirus japonicus]|uniref:Uncharacterized protein n=1 Tax=Cotonvirus japonicus TaxID=2811091 RepID=A0ABM7NU83_9VIRU|nr:hypothetical protein QLL95_gp0383 [Cotonvirus japonicus]BCS83740.1 hypothetical protein [Cotonvirus japonicus]